MSHVNAGTPCKELRDAKRVYASGVRSKACCCMRLLPTLRQQASTGPTSSGRMCLDLFLLHQTRQIQLFATEPCHSFAYDLLITHSYGEANLVGHYRLLWDSMR